MKKVKGWPLLGLASIPEAAGPGRLHATDPLETPPLNVTDPFSRSVPPHSIGSLFGLPIFLTRSKTKKGSNPKHLDPLEFG